jgi:hypothetical protein
MRHVNFRHRPRIRSLHAFAEWQENQGANGAGTADRNANTIVEALLPLIEDGKLRIHGVATSSAAAVAE